MKAIAKLDFILVMIILVSNNLVYTQDNKKEYYKKGVDYGMAGQFELAKVEFLKALKLDPYYTAPRISLSIVEDVLFQKIKNMTAIHIFKSTAYGNNLKIYDAINELNKALEIDSRYPWIYNYRASMYEQLSLYNNAIADYSKAIEINPKFKNSYYNRGALYDGIGQYDQAIADFSEVIKIDPKDILAYNGLGSAHKHLKLYDKAISDFTKAIALDQKYFGSYFNRANVYDAKGLSERAISDYNKTIELNPTWAVVYYNKAITCEEAGRVREAIEAYKAFLKNASTEMAYKIDYAKQKIMQLLSFAKIMLQFQFF